CAESCSLSIHDAVPICRRMPLELAALVTTRKTSTWGAIWRTASWRFLVAKQRSSDGGTTSSGKRSLRRATVRMVSSTESVVWVRSEEHTSELQSRENLV